MHYTTIARYILVITLVSAGAVSVAAAQGVGDFEGLTQFVSQYFGSGEGGIPELLNGLFNLAILIGSTLAVIMIAVAGIQYMTTDAVTQKTEGKRRIAYAVAGLLMLLSTWLLFNVINPNILNLNVFELTYIPSNRTETTPASNAQAPIQYEQFRWVDGGGRNPPSCTWLGDGWVSVAHSSCGDSRSSLRFRCCGKEVGGQTPAQEEQFRWVSGSGRNPPSCGSLGDGWVSVAQSFCGDSRPERTNRCCAKQ